MITFISIFFMIVFICPRIIIIILSHMKENPIKLSQIVTQKQIRQKKRGSMHALSNSFKRNTLMSCESATNYQSCYECKLPQVNFSRRDLSIILRYLLYKQQMQPSDRNLLRRILLSIFEEDLITAGTKKFVNYLKQVKKRLRLEEGHRFYQQLDEDDKQFYFVLKGKGVITSGQFTYNVKQGSTFGSIEILSNEKIQKIQFQSKFLLLRLNEAHFNEFFRNYFEKIFKEKQNHSICIKENFLDKIPQLNKYLLWNKLDYKTFDSGEKIVIEGEALKYLYFINNNTFVDGISNKCICLSELLKQKKTVKQTIYCNKKTLIPFIDVETFTLYVLNNCNQSFIMNESSAFDQFNMNTKSSFEMPQKIHNFMNIKIVKLKMNRSYLKTEGNEFYQTNFKFFKPSHNRPSLNPQKMLIQTRPSIKSRYQRIKNLTSSKPFRNNYM